jgi:hypothetical protein
MVKKRKASGWTKHSKVKRQRRKDGWAHIIRKHRKKLSSTKPAKSVSKAVADRLDNLRKLGIKDFESADAVQQRHDDLRERLKSNAFFRTVRDSLGQCTASSCARGRCVEVCAFADWRRRLKLIPTAQQLVNKAGTPVCEVRVVRGVWARPVGKLRDVSITAAKKLNRRALDSFYIPTLIALGTFKVSLAESDEFYWVCEIHEVVAGADKAELEKAFTRKWGKEEYDSIVHVTEVSDIANAINRVFSGNLQGWHHPLAPDLDAAKPEKEHREEYYSWLFSLRFGGRIVRYGCDRYLNPLNKKPRVITAKVRKRRPYPTWLTRHMFGNREQPLRGFGDEPRRRRRHW